MDPKHCRGCRNDFYNGRGNKCWSLKNAKLIMRKEVHIDQRPPWNQPAKLLPDCYHAPRHVYVTPDQTC